ncbi:dCMP deaminase [Nematocida sp. LUAm1]|nr:dCMP deaminase [Nematocida sp. LUAm2]KAI5178574.1 dCMP deaminase [Nematocida sp. LUAm1]
MLFCVSSHLPRAAEKITKKLIEKGAKRIFCPNEEEALQEVFGWNEHLVILFSSPKEWRLFSKRPCSLLLLVTPTIRIHDLSEQYCTYYNTYYSELSEIRMRTRLTRMNSVEIQEDSQDLDQIMSYTVRPSWKEYFISLAHTAAERANCMKRRIGAVIVKNNRVVSVGYNGTSTGTKNCIEGGCSRCNSNARQGSQLGECFCIHAEESALLQCDFSSCSSGDLYTTVFPCRLCSRKIVQMNIKNIYYVYEYVHDEDVLSLFKANNINIEKLKE